jgi:hypothetical protein
MQAPAAATQPTPTSGMLDMKVQTAALTKHRNIAKTPTSILAMDPFPNDQRFRDDQCNVTGGGGAIGGHRLA